MSNLEVCKKVYSKVLKDGYVTKSYLHSNFKTFKLGAVLIVFENNNMELYDETVTIPNPNFGHKGSTIETIEEVRYYSLKATYDEWRKENKGFVKNGHIITNQRSMVR